MDRRVFFRILSTTGAVAATSSCGTDPRRLMPLLVPEQEIVPGEEQWHPAVCTECSAGCGTIVRVMEGERVITDPGDPKGQQVRERVAAIKKIEGNPLDPVSGGKLCARGQAAVQSLYHPDRLRGPMQRSGDRGTAQFSPIKWEVAIASAAEKINKVRSTDPGKIVFVTNSGAGSRSVVLDAFSKALKMPAPVMCSITDHPVERKAAEMVFGWKGLPVYDLANADFVLSVGADLLGGWTSPVYYGRQFGNFRRGRNDVRGRLVQAESRLSITAAAADRWLPVKPGREPQFLAAVGRLLIDQGSARNIKDLPKSASDTFRNADVKSLLVSAGLQEMRVREAVEELGRAKAPIVIGGASIVQSDSLDTVIATHYLNVMLGSVGKPGGVLAPAPSAAVASDNFKLADAVKNAQVILLDSANPAYLFPVSSGIQDALKRAETVISFASTLNDSSAWADLILPDHGVLESEIATVPAVASKRGVTVGRPFIRPLYDTQPLETTLGDLAAKMNVSYSSPSLQEFLQPFVEGETSVEEILRAGGAWSEAESKAPALHIADAKFEVAAAAPSDAAFPLEFQPYPSLQYRDGSGANLPWMQELPDPVSSSIWGLPVELDPKTAADLRVANGDVVRVESPHGSIEAPAYVHPGAIPGVVSMPIGDGHMHYGRYASGRGANPLTILAANYEKSTGALILGGTRVKVSRVGDRKNWIQFSAPDREERDVHR